jgi:hypothetical protein
MVKKLTKHKHPPVPHGEGIERHVVDDDENDDISPNDVRLEGLHRQVENELWLDISRLDFGQTNGD